MWGGLGEIWEYGCSKVGIKWVFVCLCHFTWIDNVIFLLRESFWNALRWCIRQMFWNKSVSRSNVENWWLNTLKCLVSKAQNYKLLIWARCFCAKNGALYDLLVLSICPHVLCNYTRNNWNKKCVNTFLQMEITYISDHPHCGGLHVKLSHQRYRCRANCTCNL